MSLARALRGVVGMPAPLRALTPACTQHRMLNLHEYQSKGLMLQHDIRVQKFRVAENAADAAKFAIELNVPEIVLKAQIHAGGRGKGVFSSGLKSGVWITKNPADIGPLTEKMIGFTLKTKQTPPAGVLVNKVGNGSNYIFISIWNWIISNLF